MPDIQNLLSKLPGTPWAKYSGEQHFPGYNYLGTGRRLDIRLDENDKPKPGEEPINAIDAAAYRHDLVYRDSEDKSIRHIADKKMIEELKSINNLSLKQKLLRILIIKILQVKLN